jgi:hypothetical protein
MLDLDGELRLDMFRKGVVGSWRLVGCTFRGSDIYVFGGGSPRAVDGDS